MATYTAVLVTAPELSQDEVLRLLSGVGIVAFMGPGSLVQDIDPEEWAPAEEIEQARADAEQRERFGSTDAGFEERILDAEIADAEGRPDREE